MTVNFGMVNPNAGMNLMDMPLMNAYSGMATGAMGMGAGMVGTYGFLNFRNQNNAQFQMQAQNGSIQRQVQILAQEIKANNQDNIKSEYTKLLQAIKASYGSQLQGTEEEKELTLKQYADQLYAQQTGTYMTEDLKANGRSSFGDGFMKIFSFGMGNKTSVEENLEMMTGVKQTTGSKASNVCGKILGTICTLGLGWLGNL